MKYVVLAIAPISAAGLAPMAVAKASRIPASAMTKERNSDQNCVLKTTEVLKIGKRLETVNCLDFNMLDGSFKPEEVNYAAYYGPKGHARPTETVSGNERFTPV
ncbi:hypothetical protein [Polymorphobacter megasporae]|uniref:hypothetical protein n=1 Tax=Glacieibacterium megasporae TaxID=2835787 RepID=UPI001C1E338B|nr:hypothetical protein [Polymorphobacter megasporae]UAJ12549.1 hypothetical protein KTC28_18470 [Polymorphobacter megasporae]